MVKIRISKMSNEQDENVAAGLKPKSIKGILLSWTERKTLLKWTSGYFLFAALLFAVVGINYLLAYPFPNDLLALSYTTFAFVSHFASISLILWVGIIFPLVMIAPFKKVIISVSVILVSFVLCLILLDSQVYGAHRFHFTMLTIKILGWKTWGFGIFYLFLFVLFNSFLVKLSWDRFIIKKKRTLSVSGLVTTVLLLTATHVTHIWADAVSYVEITRFTTTLPLFYPSTALKFMVKHGYAKLDNRNDLSKQKVVTRGTFYYPSDTLQFAPTEKYRNVLVICVDAMRRDVMTDEFTPNCMESGKQYGTIFTNHWSGGNSTKMGLFSLFYGIAATYQPYVESNKRSPVLIDQLQKKDFDIGVFTSYQLYAPASLDITAFVTIRNLRMDTKIPGAQESFRKDSAITAEWIDWVGKRAESKPFFGFLFYDALCTQSAPADFKKSVRSKRPGLDDSEFANYKVSMLYIDSLIGVVLSDLQKRNLLENTLVVITSDHGEEFNDENSGLNGHGSAFSDYQLKVPLIVLSPEKKGLIVNKRTSHYDIVPTIMSEVLQCTSSPAMYSSGSNLFSETQWDWLVAGSYYNFGIVEPDQITVQFPGGFYEVRDHHYKIMKKPQFSDKLTEALNENGRFFKKQ
jgi:membrane-anchored protein YejM (alkaline phosphatase superfamily)